MTFIRDKTVLYIICQYCFLPQANYSTAAINMVQNFICLTILLILFISVGKYYIIRESGKRRGRKP